MWPLKRRTVVVGRHEGANEGVVVGVVMECGVSATEMSEFKSLGDGTKAKEGLKRADLTPPPK